MIKIKDILKLDSLSQAKLLTNEEKKNNRVTRVNIMDAPDIINWVKKNELLLTTGFSIQKKIKNLDKFIKNLSKSGCAGLAIKSNRYFNNIPPEIIESGNKYGLPIIEIPTEVVLGEILNEILNEILLKDNFEKNKIIPLLNNSFNFENIERIIDLIGQALNYDISFESPFINKNITYKAENSQNKTKDLDNKIFTIKKQNIVLGKLIIYFNKNDIYKSKKLSIVYFSLNILEFLLNKKRLELSKDHKIKNEVIDKLINYKEINKDDLFNQLTLLNRNIFKNNVFFQIITVSYKNDKDDKKIVLKDKFKKIINDFENEFENKSDIQLLGGLYNKNIVFITAAKNKNTNIEYIDLYTNHLNYLSTLYFPNCDLAIGISDTEKKLVQIKKQYFNSITANYIAHERKNNVFQYENLGILEDIYDPKNGMTLNKITENHLGPIIKDKNHKEYIKTLKVYFENNENINKASENLYIHRNSLKYRLNKIEKITNKNIDNLEDKLKLYIGIKAYEIINGSTKKDPN